MKLFYSNRKQNYHPPGQCFNEYNENNDMWNFHWHNTKRMGGYNVDE
jgi:hypothetical protein